MTDDLLLTTSLRTVNGFFLCAESGGGSDVMADRVEPGPWETWTPVLNEDGTVSLQAHNGLFVCAELDGTVNATRAEVGPWESFTIEVRGLSVAFKTHHGTYLQAPLGGGPGIRVVHASGPQMPGEWEFFIASEEFWVTTPVCPRPLVGRLRVQDKLFYDDSGPRRVLFCSWFPALRILRDSPAEFYRQLDSITTSGYQGIRIMSAVGGWDDYWNGREVAPVGFVKWFFTGNHLRTDSYSYFVEAWPNYDDLLRELLFACRERKLRLHICCGDMQVICPDPNAEIDLHRRLARICAEEGGLDVIAFSEVTNEFPLNRYGGESPESIEQMGRVIDVWESALPGVITAMGAIPQNEEPAVLEKASTYGTVCAVHVTRTPFDKCLKRTQSLVYFEGDYRAFPKAFWSGEPAGPGPDSYQPLNDPAQLVALHFMHMLMGEATNFFQGAGVRSFMPLETEWGFTEIPSILNVLPEDVATWDHAANIAVQGILYHFKGNQFATAVTKEWNTTPPRPVASWTLYTGTGISYGTGNPPQGITGGLTGIFA